MRVVAPLLIVALGASVARAEHHHHHHRDAGVDAPAAGSGSGSGSASVSAADPGSGSGSRSPAPVPAAATDGTDAARATALLVQLSTTTDAAARAALITQLDELAPRAIDAIGAFLARPHAISNDDRRNVLKAIKATYPNKNGVFSTPPRQTGKEAKADDDLDWLGALAALDPATPGVGDVIADDVAIRALASTHDIHAAQLIFNAAFGADTMIYRDECGRYLRKMEPASVPALTQESQGEGDRRRYATWQLERMDRQEPGKALAATTGDEALTVALLDAFRATHHREAVQAVWGKVNADSPRVRAAARAAWMAYVTGPPPPPAPKKKLTLPGGKLAKKETPLWLTYRELADVTLRAAAGELLHEDYPAPDPENNKKGVSIDLEDVTKRIFAYYDAERVKRDSGEWAAAKAKADAGDLAAATTMLDRLLAGNADFGAGPDRPAMAKVYFAWGKQLEGKAQWADASAAYSKAAGLDPTGPNATNALAAHHFTLGKALEAQGKDGGPSFRRAIALRPDYAPAKTAEKLSASATAGKPVWMLYAAGGAGVLAVLLLAVGLARRRA
jgi:hypothetical protein